MNKILPTKESSTGNLSSRIYLDLRQKLIVGDLRPAEALSIRTLAENYGVSAMPVREALRQLASEDALVGAAKKAYRVPDLTSDEAANLFFVRAVLEGAAAEQAAAMATEADFEVLEGLAQSMEAPWKQQDASTFLKQNHLFHRHVYSLSGNAALTSMIDSLYMRTGPWLAHGIVELVNPEYWEGYHPEIIQALRERDGAKARHLAEKDAGWGVDLYRHLK